MGLREENQAGPSRFGLAMTIDITEETNVALCGRAS